MAMERHDVTFFYGFSKPELKRHSQNRLRRLVKDVA